MTTAESNPIQTSLEDHPWVLTSYNGNAVLEGTQITADFRDGQVRGSAGCNSYFAPYERTTTELRVGAVGSTRIFCTQPQGVMEQESTYLGLLQSSATYQINEDKLVIHDSSGKRILTYNAAASS